MWCPRLKNTNCFQTHNTEENIWASVWCNG